MSESARTLTHDEASRLDFVEGVRSFNYRHVVRPLLADYERRVDGAVASGAQAPESKEAAGDLYRYDSDYQFSCGIQRTMQQIGWATAAAAVHRDGDQIVRMLEQSARHGDCGQLELDPDLAVPKWFTRDWESGHDDIHLVPGGYWSDDLVGPIYDIGGAAYRLAWRSGYDARPGALEMFVRAVPTGGVRRVLDLGCSFGGLSRVMRKVFTEAEVIGIDVSAPALRYAHHLSQANRLAITYAQRNAVATGYADASFDVVGAFLLMHEVPDEARAEIVREAYRVLRPGGHLMSLDIPPYSALSPAEAWFESFDARGNGENFWEEYLASDFPALLTACGFDVVREGPLDHEEPSYWGSSALWRTGSFRDIHRWMAIAQRPAEVT